MNHVRPKVRAAGEATVASTGSILVIVWLLRLAGVDVDAIPAEVQLTLGGTIVGGMATAAAYLKRDGLRGAWERLVDGQLEPRDIEARAQEIRAEHLRKQRVVGAIPWDRLQDSEKRMWRQAAERNHG